MKTPPRQAFTLIELLVVVGIISILAAVLFPVLGAVQLSGRRTQSLSNMRQLGTALLGYSGDNNGTLPTQGEATPSWGSSTDPAYWYNAVPHYANSKGFSDYTSNTASDFYTKNSLFFVPAAVYPASKLSSPQFAVAFNSKLETSSITNARLALFSAPAETVVFQESGLPGENVIKGQKAYTNQAASYASRTVARYGGQTILTFADGHAALVTGTDVVDPSTGKAYFPPKPGGAAVYWSIDTATNPNS